MAGPLIKKNAASLRGNDGIQYKKSIANMQPSELRLFHSYYPFLKKLNLIHRKFSFCMVIRKIWKFVVVGLNSISNETKKISKLKGRP